ncbi:MAG TPA: sigma-54 dependent transcriptional regulator [Chitinophagaceae bacterium]|nr:sigma-54 dependent transcriptional regulator [Chitinophagaceae bacterium]
MAKILISWLAFNNDFTWMYRGTPKEHKDQVKENGPTFNVHRFFGDDYEKHILLSNSEKPEDIKFFNLLVSEVKKAFKHKIEPRIVLINDPINISEIFSKVSDLLLEFKNDEVEIFVNPGTPQMQIAWHLVKPNFKKNVTLFQLREAKFTKEKIQPERIYVDIDTIFNPMVISVASEVASRKATDNRILISGSIKPVYDKAKRISQTKDVGCLILGENGTGKENLAAYIHMYSSRADEAFKAVNCAAYSDDLLRSELFGHEKGSFTGADKQKIGIFEEANGGTIFLDEIGDISPKMQVSLLRVIQEKKIQRVGGLTDIPINVRVIAATNKNIEQLCDKEIFRWDLYFRLAVTTLKLPALRDWSKREIKDLIEHFNNACFPEFPNRQQKLKFSNEALEQLSSYHFRGNVRELQNIIISLYTFCQEEVSLKDLPERITTSNLNPSSKEENEKAHIREIYTSKKENLKATAEVLGMSRDTLRRKLIKYNLYKQSN